MLSADENAEFRAGDGANLAGHRAAKTLPLEHRRQIGRGTAGPEKAKEFHDTSPCKLSHGAAGVVWTKAAR